MTEFLQASMFCASLCYFMSLRTLSIHLCLGLPRVLFPPTSIFLISFATFLWSLLRRVHTDNFTRRANRSRRVRAGFARIHTASTASGSSGTLRPHREVFSVDANGTRRVGECSVNARVGASGTAATHRLRMTAD